MLLECLNLSSDELAVENNHSHGEGGGPGSREGKSDQNDINRDIQVSELQK